MTGSYRTLLLLRHGIKLLSKPRLLYTSMPTTRRMAKASTGVASSSAAKLEDAGGSRMTSHTQESNDETIDYENGGTDEALEVRCK